MNSTKINLSTLQATFSLPLRPDQIPAFRGAVADSAGWDKDFFHNHDNRLMVGEPQPVLAGIEGKTESSPLILSNKTYFYRYPSIQYRVKKGQATIWSIGEGINTLRQWLFQRPDTFMMKGRKHRLLITSLQEQAHTLQMLPNMQTYRLMDYQPLNQENHRLWQNAESLHQRIDLLERILVGNIISFANAVDYRLSERLEVKLMLIKETKSVRTHGTKRLAFNLIYKANIDLPAEIALGRAVSHGFGVNMPTRG